MATAITPTAIEVGFSHASTGSPAALPSGTRPEAMPPIAAPSANGVSTDEAPNSAPRIRSSRGVDTALRSA